MIWIKQCWNTDLEGDLPELLLIWHQHQCKSYDNTLVNVPIQTASACSGMWVFCSLDDWKNHNKNCFFDLQLKWLSMQCKIMKVKLWIKWGALLSPSLPVTEVTEKYVAQKEISTWTLGTDISKYFPQKTITKSWGCYKPSKCCIFPEKPMCIDCVLKLHATLSHAEQSFSVKRNTDI